MKSQSVSQYHMILLRTCTHLTLWPEPAAISRPRHICIGKFMIQCPAALANVQTDTASLFEVKNLDERTFLQPPEKCAALYQKDTQRNIYKTLPRRNGSTQDEHSMMQRHSFFAFFTLSTSRRRNRGQPLGGTLFQHHKALCTQRGSMKRWEGRSSRSQTKTVPVTGSSVLYQGRAA